MGKATKRVWTPTEYAVDIGNNEYIIAPQPIERFIEFSDVVSGLSGQIESLGDQDGLDAVLGVIINTPYPALKVLIPDLQEEDLKLVSLPQLKFIFDLLVEVNGVEWLQSFVKNSLGPLLPKLVTSALAGVQPATSTPSTEMIKVNGATG